MELFFVVFIYLEMRWTEHARIESHNPRIQLEHHPLHVRHRPHEWRSRVLDRPHNPELVAHLNELDCQSQQLVAQVHFGLDQCHAAREDPWYGTQRRWASVVLPSLTERRARSSKMDVENIGFYDQLFDVLEDLVVRDVHWLRVMVERMKPIFDRRAEWFWSIWTPTPRNSQPYDQGLLTTITPSFLSNVPKRQVNYMNSYIYDHDSS